MFVEKPPKFHFILQMAIGSELVAKCSVDVLKFSLLIYVKHFAVFGTKQATQLWIYSTVSSLQVRIMFLLNILV